MEYGDAISEATRLASETHLAHRQLEARLPLSEFMSIVGEISPRERRMLESRGDLTLVYRDANTGSFCNDGSEEISIEALGPPLTIPRYIQGAFIVTAGKYQHLFYSDG